jgi:hypothetical protein
VARLVFASALWDALMGDARVSPWGAFPPLAAGWADMRRAWSVTDPPQLARNWLFRAGYGVGARAVWNDTSGGGDASPWFEARLAQAPAAAAAAWPPHNAVLGDFLRRLQVDMLRHAPRWLADDAFVARVTNQTDTRWSAFVERHIPYARLIAAARFPDRSFDDVVGACID